MSFTYRSAATSTNSATCNKPTGTVDNDFMVACVLTFGDAALTPPSGWTEHYTKDDTLWGSGVSTYKFFSKVASSEGSSYTWTGYAGSYIDIAILSYSGSTSPTWDEGNYSETVANSATIANGAVTTDTTNELIIYFGACLDHAETWTCTGATERIDYDEGLFVAEEIQSAAGLSTARTFTMSASGTYFRMSITGCWKETAAAGGQPFAKRQGGVPFQGLNRGVW
jgi:hypothetical protein